MKRVELEKTFGTKKIYIATFSKYSISKSKCSTTLLLTDIKDKFGNLITDHIWLRLNEEENLNSIKFKKNMKIKFVADVEKYYKVISEDANYKHYGEDYKLYNLQEVKRVNGIYIKFYTVFNKIRALFL